MNHREATQVELLHKMAMAIAKMQLEIGAAFADGMSKEEKVTRYEEARESVMEMLDSMSEYVKTLVEANE